MTPHYTTLFRSIDDGEISVRPLLHLVHRNPMRQCQKEHVRIIIINLTRRDQGDIYCIVQMGMDSSQALAFIRFTGDKFYRYIWVLCSRTSSDPVYPVAPTIPALISAMIFRFNYFNRFY